MVTPSSAPTATQGTVLGERPGAFPSLFPLCRELSTVYLQLRQFVEVDRSVNTLLRAAPILGCTLRPNQVLRYLLSISLVCMMVLRALLSVKLRSDSLALQRNGTLTAGFVRIGGRGNTPSLTNHEDSNEVYVVLGDGNSEDRFCLS